MKITKFVHSCLLVETPDLSALIDPGNYSWNSHLLTVDRLPRLDYIVITHEHPDHYHLPLLQALCAQFPHVSIITNGDLAKKLEDEGLTNQTQTASDQKIEVFEAAHEPLPFNLPVPSNIGVHISEALTHPGDALHISQSRDILALPVTAPWGSLKQSLEVAVTLKPKIILPIHDWHWHQAARAEMYTITARLLEPHGIKFVALENAVPINL